MLAAIAAGCGEVTLIDPEADLRASLTIGGVVRVHVADDPSLYILAETRVAELPRPYQLVLEGPEARVVVPEASVVETGCDGDRVCWVLALPALGFTPDELVLEVPSLRHESRARVDTQVAAALAVQLDPRSSGLGLAYGVADPLGVAVAERGWPWRRSYDIRLTPGACDQVATPDAPGWLRAQPERGLIPVSADAWPVCFELRRREPIGAAPWAQTVAPIAQVDTFDHEFAPPLELAPLVWRVISDLQLPSEAACARSEARVEGAMRAAAETIAVASGEPLELYALPTLRLAMADGRPCQQAPDRRLDVATLRAELDAQVTARFGETARVRTLVVYVSNLDTEPPDGLREDREALVAGDEASGPRRIALVSISPPRAAVGPALSIIDFAAASEPAFAAAVLDGLRVVWPFGTLIHTPDTRIPLVPADARQRYRYFSILSASEPIVPIGESYARVLMPDEAGPAYTVPLGAQILEPAAGSTRPRVSVTWSGCRDRCTFPGHPRARSAWILEP